MTTTELSEDALRERVLGYIGPILKSFLAHPERTVILLDEAHSAEEGRLNQATIVTLLPEDVRLNEAMNPGLDPPEGLERGRWVLYAGESLCWFRLQELDEAVRNEARKRGLLPLGA